MRKAVPDSGQLLTGVKEGCLGVQDAQFGNTMNALIRAGLRLINYSNDSKLFSTIGSHGMPSRFLGLCSGPFER
jgi:hypothetical protein